MRINLTAQVPPIVTQGLNGRSFPGNAKLAENKMLRTVLNASYFNCIVNPKYQSEVPGENVIEGGSFKRCTPEQIAVIRSQNQPFQWKQLKGHGGQIATVDDPQLETGDAPQEFTRRDLQIAWKNGLPEQQQERYEECRNQNFVMVNPDPKTDNLLSLAKIRDGFCQDDGNSPVPFENLVQRTSEGTSQFPDISFPKEEFIDEPSQNNTQISEGGGTSQLPGGPSLGAALTPTEEPKPTLATKPGSVQNTPLFWLLATAGAAGAASLGSATVKLAALAIKRRDFASCSATLGIIGAQTALTASVGLISGGALLPAVIAGAYMAGGFVTVCYDQIKRRNAPPASTSGEPEMEALNRER